MQESNQAGVEPKELLAEIIRLMGIEARVSAAPGPEEGQVLLQVDSPDAAQLIGRNAQGLDALQAVLNRMLSPGGPGGPYCVVDAEHYRERRQAQVVQDAHDAADKAVREGRPVRFRPLGAADRRMIHQALRDDRRVETFSEPEDEDGLKRLVVRPVGARGAPPPPAAAPAAPPPAEDPPPDEDSRGNV